MQLNENRIRECAYQIWESEGKPSGCAEKHWDMACKTLQAEESHTENTDRDNEHHDSDTFIPHQNTKKGKHAHHPSQPH
jgi:hypothetical protein